MARSPAAADERPRPSAAVQIFESWGIATLGDLVALPAADLASRLGRRGSALQRLARGLDARPFVPDSETPRYLERLELEWPIDELEPLSFVLARLLDPLSAALERADRGAAAVHLDLRLTDRSTDARVLQLPAPMRDARVLRTLLLLDLESHPPSAAIDIVSIEVDPAPARITQFSLLERALPSPETLTTLTARLSALIGESRVGAPALVDTHRPGAFEMRQFQPESAARENTDQPAPDTGVGRADAVMRRQRVPPAIRVNVERGRPVFLSASRRGMPSGAVTQAAGPWQDVGRMVWGELESRRMGRRAEERRHLSHLSGSFDGALVFGWRVRLTVIVYIELHASSAFSFLDGASLPEALVARAVELGYPALALLNRDGVYGAPRFHMAAKKAGLKAIIGAELTVASRGSRPEARGPEDRISNRDRRSSNLGPRTSDLGPRTSESIFKLPVLIESQEGYRNLCRLLTKMKLRAPKGEGALALDDLDGATSGLIVLAGRTMLSGVRFGVGGLVDRLVGLFGRDRTYIELQRHLLRDEEADNHALRDLAAAFHVPIVATNGVRFAQPADRPLYDVLTCIRHKTTVERAGRRLSCNAERYLKDPDQMARLFIRRSSD